MLRFFLKGLCARPHLLAASGSFLVSVLGGWALLMPPQAPPLLSHVFFWTVLAFCLQNGVQVSLGEDLRDGTLKSIQVSTIHMGAFLLARFVSLLVFGGLLLAGGLLVHSFFVGGVSALESLTWFLALPSLLSIIFFASTLSLLTRPSFMLGTFLAYPLMIPLFILIFLAESEEVARNTLAGLACLFVPLALIGAKGALRITQEG